MASGQGADTPRKQLGALVAELLEKSELSLRAASATVPGGALNVRTLRNWRDGISAPSASHEPVFVELINGLREAAAAHGHRSPYGDADWEKALRAAQQQGGERRGLSSAQQQEGRRRGDESGAPDPGTRFLQTHLAASRAAEGFTGRRAERAVMHAFIRASSPSAPSYLCWYAERPVGKTALLADYVLRPERTVNVVTFFVSATQGTNTRADFCTSVGQQLRLLLHHQGDDAPDELPRDAHGWAVFLNRAAAKSAAHGRKLVLVVDGLDEDVAWADCAWNGGDPKPDSDKPCGTFPSGSIAALLPAHPAPDLRVIVSTRWSTPPAGDIPAGHPLRRRECYRSLGPSPHAAAIEPVRRAEAERLGSHSLGRTIMELLAVAGGGLRPVDLAELAGVSVTEIERLVHGPDGRCVVLDDAVTGTYTLSHADILRSVRQDIGAAGVAQRSGKLHVWAELWRSGNWPGTTPPYLLQGYLHLLDDPERRRVYVLDARRLTQLADSVGHDIALAQVDALDAEQPGPGEDPVGPDQVATAVRIAASRAYMRGRARNVPLDALLLYVTLGDASRARALARTMPGPVAEAAALAQIAVAMRRKGLAEGSAALAEDAMASLSRANRIFPCPAEDADAYEAIAGAAHELRELGSEQDALALLRVLILSGAGTIETVVAAANTLPVNEAQEWVTVIVARADDLSAGDAKAKAAAVDIWATIAHRIPSRSRFARQRIIATCDELDTADGLAAVDALALAASALKRSKVLARRLVTDAMARLSAALADPEVLSPADRAHLGRELSTTLERLSQAANDLPRHLDTAADLHKLMSTHREMLRSGLLDDDLAERGAANLEVGEHRWASENSVYRRARIGLPVLSEDRPTETQPDQSALQARLPQHLALLRQAGRLVHDGDPLRGRQRLEEALRRLPTRTESDAARSHWTVSLAQALGVSGEFSAADRLALVGPQPESRCHRLAALAIGCSQGGHKAEARRYAQAAAELAGELHDPLLRGLTAQALAHAGEASSADEMATRADPADAVSAGARRAQIRQSLTVVAAGLAHSAPDTAARLIEPLTRSVQLRLGHGSPFNPLAKAAELLLAFPDIRRPGPEVGELLHTACDFLHAPRQSWHPRSVVLLALLERLRYVPDTAGVADAMDAWVSTLPPDQVPCAELGVLKAVEGDIDRAVRVAESATTPADRALALAAVATRLAGTDVTLAPDPASQCASVRLHLTLAHAARDRATYDKSAARSLVLKLIATGSWAQTILLLPQLAPEALVPLTELALVYDPMT